MDRITEKFLKGQELQLQGMALQLEAFNEAIQTHPVVSIPLAMDVRAERIEENSSWMYRSIPS